jgi:hypothetical protein
MSAPRPRAYTATRAVEAWHAWSEHGKITRAARALGVGVAAIQGRLTTYRRLHGLHRLAKPWDPTGLLVLLVERRDICRANDALDTLLETLEHAETAGDDVLAMHIRRHMHRLEARVYGAGVA